MKGLVRALFGYAKRLIHSNRALRSLLYDNANVRQFSDLDYHEVMLADRIRVDAYHAGIKKAVKPGDVVIDLGTGTGILAMFAARAGARKVYAIEHGDVIDVARAVAESNGITNIEFVRTNSRDFSARELADVIVHEQIGSYLFDENMVENLLDLKSRALKPGGRILPAKFQFFVEPVQLKPDHRLPFSWEAPIHGIDFTALRSDEAALRQRRGRGKRFIANGAIEHYVCDPRPLCEFDLDAITDASEIPTSFRQSRVVVNSGRIDGLSVFFKASLGAGLSIDNALDSPNTNWTYPLVRLPAREVTAGDTVTLTLEMESHRNADTWKFELS